MAAIKYLFHISASKQKVYEAISTIKGLSQLVDSSDNRGSKTGSVIQFRFAGMGGPGMKVKEMIADKSLTWECVASPHGRIGNTLTFTLDDNDGKTRVRFSHDGWKEQGDFYGMCSFSRGRYMESLRQYCQAGKDEAFGNGGYRK